MKDNAVYIRKANGNRIQRLIHLIFLQVTADLSTKSSQSKQLPTSIKRGV